MYSWIDLPVQAFVMKRWQARVWPLYSGASVTINGGGMFLLRFWIVFSDDIFLVIRLLLWFSGTVSCFK